MQEFNTDPQPIKCAKCGENILVRLSDFKKGNIITCSKCKFQMQVNDDYFQQVQDSLKKLKKSIANLNKKF